MSFPGVCKVLNISAPWSSGHGQATLTSPCSSVGQPVFAQMPQGTMAMEQSFTGIAAQILALHLGIERATA